MKLERETENLQGVNYKKHLDANWQEIENNLNSVSAALADAVLHSSGDSNLEVVAARTDSEGTTHATLKDNLDYVQGLIADLKLHVYTQEEINTKLETLSTAITDLQDAQAEIDTNVATQLANNLTKTNTAISTGLANKQDTLTVKNPNVGGRFINLSGLKSFVSTFVYRPSEMDGWTIQDSNKMLYANFDLSTLIGSDAYTDRPFYASCVMGMWASNAYNTKYEYDNSTSTKVRFAMENEAGWNTDGLYRFCVLCIGI